VSESVEAAPPTAQPIAARTAAGRKRAGRKTRSVRPNGGAPTADVAARQGASTQPLSVGTPQINRVARVVRALDPNDDFVAADSSLMEAIGPAALMALMLSRPEMAPQVIGKARSAPGIGAPSRRPLAGEKCLAPAAAPTIRPEMTPQLIEKPRFGPGIGAPSARSVLRPRPLG